MTDLTDQLEPDQVRSCPLCDQDILQDDEHEIGYYRFKGERSLFLVHKECAAPNTQD